MNDKDRMTFVLIISPKRKAACLVSESTCNFYRQLISGRKVASNQNPELYLAPNLFTYSCVYLARVLESCFCFARSQKFHGKDGIENTLSVFDGIE